MRRPALSQILARQETYYQQHGSYADVSTGGTFYPALSRPEPKAKQWTAPPNQWKDLGARPPGAATYFSYFVRASVGPNHALDANASKLRIPAQPAAPMTDRDRDLDGEEQGFEFPELVVGEDGAVDIFGRGSHNMYRQRLNAEVPFCNPANDGRSKRTAENKAQGRCHSSAPGAGRNRTQSHKKWNKGKKGKKNSPKGGLSQNKKAPGEDGPGQPSPGPIYGKGG